MFWSKKNSYEKLSKPLKSGLHFGLTSGVITTLGLMIGLLTGTGSKLAILGGVLTIAIADALSDAFGMYMSVQSSNRINHQKLWQATIATLLSKFFFAITFLLPVILFELKLAILISCLWGLFLLTIISLLMAKSQKAKPTKMVIEHLIMAILVITISYFAGTMIHQLFANI